MGYLLLFDLCARCLSRKETWTAFVSVVGGPLLQDAKFGGQTLSWVAGCTWIVSLYATPNRRQDIQNRGVILSFPPQIPVRAIPMHTADKFLDRTECIGDEWTDAYECV